MVITRFPIQAQAIYSELVERLQATEAEGLAAQEGHFATKKVKGRLMWYHRRRLGDRVLERYIGADNEETRHRVGQLRARAEDAKESAARRRELVRLLRAAGYLTPDRRTGKVFEAIADAGVFRLGAVLVGTHAFRCYSGLLGVALPGSAALTTDVDIAQPQIVSIALGETIEPGFEGALANAERFVAVPSLNRKAASTTWQTADRELRVQLLIPLIGREPRTAIELPTLKAHAHPLRFLDYLIAESVPAAVLHRSGVLLRVPTPERYALHKLIVAARRQRNMKEKARKDIAQAQALLEVLLEDRPDDVQDAWRVLRGRGPAWRKDAERSRKMLSDAIASALH